MGTTASTASAAPNPSKTLLGGNAVGSMNATNTPSFPGAAGQIQSFQMPQFATVTTPSQSVMQGEALPSLSWNPAQQNVANEQYANERKRLEDAYYANATQDYGQRFGREMESAHTNLLNQGLPIGSEAYQRAVGDLRTAQQNQWTQARNAAIQAGAQEQSRLRGLSLQERAMTGQNRQQRWNEMLQNAQLMNQARQQSLAEQQSVQNARINLLSALAKGSPSTYGAVQGPAAPQFQIQSPDYMGFTAANYGNQVDAYNAQQKAAAAPWAAAGSIIGGMASGGTGFFRS